MLKRGLIVWLVAALMSSLFLVVAQAGGEGDATVADKLAQLEAAVGNLEQMVKDIAFDAQKLDSLESITKEISFQMKGNEGKIRDLQAFQQGVEQDLRPRVVKLESGVAGLSFTMQKQGEQLTKLEGLSDVVAGLQPRVFSLETTVEGLAAKLKTDEDQLKELTGVPEKIADLDTRLTKLEGILAAISPDGVDLSGIKELKDKVFVLQNAVADLASKIDGTELGQRLSTLEAQVAALAKGLGALEERVSTLEQSLSSMRNWTTLSTVMALAAIAGFAYLMFFAG